MRHNSRSATSQTPAGGLSQPLPTSLIMVMKTIGKTKRMMTRNLNVELSDPISYQWIRFPGMKVSRLSLSAPYLGPLRALIHLPAPLMSYPSVQSRLIAYSTLIYSPRFSFSALISNHHMSLARQGLEGEWINTIPPTFATYFRRQSSIEGSNDADKEDRVTATQGTAPRGVSSL